MSTTYAAYGLRLESDFPLAGMRSARSGRELPALSLRLGDPERLSADWSGSAGPPLWRGRLGDGRDLTIESGARGDLLFAYGEHARFLLDPDKNVLVCAPLRDGLDWQRALLSKVIASVSVMRGYEALHASAVDSPEGAIAILAPSGTGKTTLALELMARGWPLLTDDVLALSQAADDLVLAHPGVPHMNLDDSAQPPEDLVDSLGLLAGEHWIAAREPAREPRPLRLICLLDRGSDQPLAAQPISPNPLALAPYMLGLLGDVDRERNRFKLYANLIASTAAIRIAAEPDDGPQDLAAAIESQLEGAARELALGGAR